MNNAAAGNNQATSNIRWPLIALAGVVVLVVIALVVWLVVRSRSRSGPREAWEDQFEMQTKNRTVCPLETDTLKAQIGDLGTSAAIDAYSYLIDCDAVNESRIALNMISTQLSKNPSCDQISGLRDGVQRVISDDSRVNAQKKDLLNQLNVRSSACSRGAAREQLDRTKSEPTSAQQMLSIVFITVVFSFLVYGGIKLYRNKRDKRWPFAG